VEWIFVENAVNRLSMSLFILEIFAVKIKSCRAHCRFWLGRNEQTELRG